MYFSEVAHLLPKFNFVWDKNFEWSASFPCWLDKMYFFYYNLLFFCFNKSFLLKKLKKKKKIRPVG